MKRTFTYSIVLLVCTLRSGYAVAQPQARGFGNAAPAGASMSAGRTVALVVGVSDYPFVAPLNYAVEDALLMNDFLQSKAGGNVPIGNIRFLANEEATLQNVWTQGLSWLENTIKPTTGDRVIIYLAGHGDAISSDESFFLCYNANPAGDKNNYNVTGALDIGKLKNRIAKFSAAGAEVVLIMDACRSGDLPGVRTGITNPFESVIERKAGETLMLSASANQLAVEDGRWGRGHGVFTWNLIQGLSGKADENGDGSVDFYEIEQFTKTKVRKETQAMGRMQAPQFAASPSGGGVLGRSDNAFLNKLSTDELSSVSVSESIAQARTAAESSWFTDSALYAGFNELKKLVRDRKYLGEGSAESVYTRLTEQFSADQIEPVRLYYMSALASAGFEAMNRQLLMEFANQVAPSYYPKRLSYLLKAQQLQLREGEVNQLRNVIKLIEAICIHNRSVNRGFNGEALELTRGMKDSLSSMRSEFGRTAAYYFWTANLEVDPRNSTSFSLASYEGSQIFQQLLDSCIKYAPDWERITTMNFFLMPQEKFDSALGERIKKRIEEDPKVSVNHLMLMVYYDKYRPYNVPEWVNCLLYWSQESPDVMSLWTLLGLLNIMNGNQSAPNLDYWVKSKLLKNYYHYSLRDIDFETVSSWIKKAYQKPPEEEVISQGTVPLIKSFVDYAAGNHQLLTSAELVNNIIDNSDYQKWSLQNIPGEHLAILSSIFDATNRKNNTTQWVDSLLLLVAEDKSYFNQPKAEFIAYRILFTEHYDELTAYREEQLRLLNQFDYPGFKNEMLLFRCARFIEAPNATPPDALLDSLIQLCHYKPELQHFQLYFELVGAENMSKRRMELRMDTCFQNRRSEFQRDVSARSIYGRLEAEFNCLNSDSVGLISLMDGFLAERDTIVFWDVLKILETDWQNFVAFEFFEKDTLNVDFNYLVDIGMYEYAEKEYFKYASNNRKYLGFETDFANTIAREMHALKLFIKKNNYKMAAQILERLIELNASGVSQGLLSKFSYDEILTASDLFLESKEYKELIGRLYTAPQK